MQTEIEEIDKAIKNAKDRLLRSIKREQLENLNWTRQRIHAFYKNPWRIEFLLKVAARIEGFKLEP